MQKNEVKIALQFDLEGEITAVKSYGNGHINNTFLITTDKNKYILQGINPLVFKRPDAIMENIKLLWNSVPDSSIILKLIPTKEGAYSVVADEKVWRVFPFASDYEVFEFVSDAWQPEKAAEAFATFAKTYADVDVSKLQDTIVDFHNGLFRFQQLETAYNQASPERKVKAAELYDFARKHKIIFEQVQHYINTGELPLRVTHNDTKLNNVLIGKGDRNDFRVIDLDTVMQGTLLYDFGDLVRTSASPTGENEPDVSKIHLNFTYFEAVCKGYSKMNDIMTPREREMMLDGAKYMIFIIGVRFLTDYYNNDVYFKISYPDENFIRARNQFVLLRCLEENEMELRAITKKYFK